jgi:hypothetical protein
MKIKRPLAFAIEFSLAIALSIAAAVAGNRVSAKYNRQAQAAERIAAALERAYPPKPDLTHPSLLHRVDIKPIPQPDPEPCGGALDRFQPGRCGL